MRARLQIHCFLDCLAYALQNGSPMEYRPVYFGSWDAPFAVTDHGISYYSKSIGMDDICRQFQQMYGNSITFLNNYSKSKPENFNTLMKHMSMKNRDQFIFVLVDLFYLSYPNQCYQTRHRPHIIIIDHMEEDKVYLIDPYFNWENFVPIEVFEQSFYCGDLNMVSMLDKSSLQNPDPELLTKCLNNHIGLSPSQLVTEVNALLDKVISEEEGYTLDMLFKAVEQVSVIAKRLRGYEMAFSYLYDRFNDQTNDYSSKLDELVKKWDHIVLYIMRICVSKNRNGFQPLKDKLMQIGLLELSIKQDLWNLSMKWEGEYNQIST